MIVDLRHYNRCYNVIDFSLIRDNHVDYSEYYCQINLILKKLPKNEEVNTPINLKIKYFLRDNFINIIESKIENLKPGYLLIKIYLDKLETQTHQYIFDKIMKVLKKSHFLIFDDESVRGERAGYNLGLL